MQAETESSKNITELGKKTFDQYLSTDKKFFIKNSTTVASTGKDYKVHSHFAEMFNKLDEMKKQINELEQNVHMQTLKLSEKDLETYELIESFNYKISEIDRFEEQKRTAKTHRFLCF